MYTVDIQYIEQYISTSIGEKLEHISGVVKVEETKETGLVENGKAGKKKNDEPKYFDAPAVEEIAKDLIPKHHSHLKNQPIMFLFVRYMSDWARMNLRSEKERFISGYHFLMEVNHKKWAELSDKQRIALVDHELCHAGIDGKSGDPMLIDHDVEEFGEIVKRHGLWRDDVKHFGYICHEQCELKFESVAA